MSQYCACLTISLVVCLQYKHVLSMVLNTLHSVAFCLLRFARYFVELTDGIEYDILIKPLPTAQ